MRPITQYIPVAVMNVEIYNMVVNDIVMPSCMVYPTAVIGA